MPLHPADGHKDHQLDGAADSESEIVIREDLCNRRGVMHGGAVMAWGDTLGGNDAASAALTGNPEHSHHREQDQFLRPHPQGR